MRTSPLPLLLVVGTWCLPAQAYRTAHDLPQFLSTTRVRWQTDQIEYVINDRGAPESAFGDVVETAQATLAVWSSPDCSAVTFDYDGSTPDQARPDDAINTIEWLRTGWSERGFDPAAGGLTDIQYGRDSAGQWQIVEADLYINAENFSWVVKGEPPRGKRDVASLLLHEGGHMLGLLHPCEIDGSSGAPDCKDSDEFEATVMHPLYESRRRELSPDDRTGVCYLYPRPHCADTGCPEGSVCDAGSCRQQCGDSLCPDGEICVEQSCVSAECWAGACPEACKLDADCDNGLRCEDGTCTRGTAGPGDPCRASADCQTAACLDGACATPCEHNQDCSHLGGLCVLDAAAGHCATQADVFGAPCSAADECLGTKCLARESGNSGQCTRTCGPAEATCPAHWTCAEVEGEPVCTPAYQTARGGGCSVVGTSDAGTGTSLLVASALFLRALLSGRRRKQS